MKFQLLRTREGTRYLYLTLGREVWIFSRYGVRRVEGK